MKVVRAFRMLGDNRKTY